MKTVATIEARMNSSRLPGKVLMPVLGKPLLGFLIERLKAVTSVDEIIVATTVNDIDSPIVDLAKNYQVSCFRGSEDDVMSRVIEAAEYYEATNVVEITGDCPLIDPDIIDQTIRVFLKNDADYCANSFYSSYPDGMDTQVIKLDALKKSYALIENDADYEHVTLHIVQNPTIFNHVYLVAPPSLTWPGLGLLLDEMSDFQLISNIIEALYPENELFTCGDIISFLKRNPQLINSNNSVSRKNKRPRL